MPALVAAIGALAAALVMLLVPAFEGTELKAYRDIAGVVTACTGNTTEAVLGRRYTPQQCRELLASDLVRHDHGLQQCLKVQLLPHQRAALLSWAFNVGVGAACSSTLVKLMNAGDVAGACAQLSRWTWVRGRDCRERVNRLFCGGIVSRRAAERAMCEGRYLGAPAATGATASGADA